MANYNKYYENEHYFGNPYKGLIEFFQKYPYRGTLADLGAGQGRDSLPLSEMGYTVTAVDISDVGLNQIKKYDAAINTINADVYSFDISNYDFILLDSMLHFYKNDTAKESAWVKKILNDMKSGALFINCMMKSKKAEEMLSYIINIYKDKIELAEIKNTYVAYPEGNCKYHLLAIKKL